MALFANLLFAELHRQGQSIRVEVHFEDLPVKNVEIVLIGLINCQTDWTDALLGKTLDIHLPAGGDALNKYGDPAYHCFMDANDTLHPEKIEIQHA